MRRIGMAERPGWRERNAGIGFTYDDPGGDGADGRYWDERVAYEFTGTEIDAIHGATEELHARVMDAVSWVVRRPEEMARFGLSPEWGRYVARSFDRGDPGMVGRFDLAFDPATHGVAMLEYNADTPTTLIEASLVQWFWLEDVRGALGHPGADQSNSLHEALLDGYRDIARRLPPGAAMHFAALDTHPEEVQHTRYQMDLAGQAGIDARFVSMAGIGRRTGCPGRPDEFVDGSGEPIRFLHKLYPWEWMARERFGEYLLEDRIGIIEPPWKMIAANKALLPVLHRLFPGHPHILPAAWTHAEVGRDSIRKPILGREGANIAIRRGGIQAESTGGSHGEGPAIHQRLVALPRFEGRHVVLGSWIVGGEAHGLVVREGAGPIITNADRVVPHYFVPGT